MLLLHKLTYCISKWNGHTPFAVYLCLVISEVFIIIIIIIIIIIMENSSGGSSWIAGVC